MLRLLRAPFQTGLGAALGPAPGCAAALLALLRVHFSLMSSGFAALMGPIVCVMKAMGLRPSRAQGAEPRSLRSLRPHQDSLALATPSPRRTGRGSWA